MKPSVLKQLCLGFCIFLSMSALAYTTEIDGIYYNASQSEARVTYRDNNYNSYSGNVVIPSSITYRGKTFSVVGIDDHAFYGCSGLTSVTIPNSVGFISSYAFYGCSGLTSITIPNGVIYIGAWAFCWCKNLTSITIPNSVAIIDENAFRGCSSLTSITIPNSVTSIGDDAFYYCSGLTSITIPNNVTSIGRYTFCGCSGLTSIIIPNSVRSIGTYAFFDCSNLTSITIPNSVTSIGSCAFASTAWYNNQPDGLVYAGKVAYIYKGTMPDGTQIAIKDGTLGIAAGAFANRTGLTSISIPNSVTSIGDYAFRNCTSLNNVHCWAEDIPKTGNNVFIDSPIESANLHVPAVSIKSYRTTLPWSNFGDIKSISYSLIYIVDGEVYKTFDIDYNAPITPLEEPTKEGYTFSGWSGLPTIMPAHDVTVTGTFTVNQYTIKFDTDGGSLIGSITQDYGSAITPPANPTRVGYTFIGWMPAIPETMPLGGLTCVAQWQANSYTLLYLVDGKEYKTSSVAYGTPITPEAAPTKEGYTFSGWSSLPATMPAHNVVVTGYFTANTYTLTYKVGGNIYKTVPVACGTTIIPEPAPTKEGYTFSGWNGLPEIMPAHDVTVTGTFSINYYTLTYKVDGNVYRTYSLIYGSAITPIAAPTKEGYTFSGWSEIPTTMPAHDVVVTGTFTANSSYFLFYVLDGSVYKAYSIRYGTTIVPETVPDKEGYTFSGWSGLPTIMPAHDVTVHGQYNINSYTLTYKVNGSVYKTFSVEYGAALSPMDTPEKEGYTFSGWSGLPATMPAHNVTVTGSFTVNYYTLTYMVGNWEYYTENIAYGSYITPKTAPTREGYSFSGWSGLPTTMPAHDVTVTGSFSVNSYTLTYKIDGKVYKMYSVAYGTSLTPEPAPVKKGMTFSGWSNVPGTMPARNVTITGTYSWSKETIGGVVYEVADTLNNYVAIVDYEGTDGEAELLSYIEIGGDIYEVHSITENALPKTITIQTSVGRLLLWLWTNGYESIKETETGRDLSAPEVALTGKTASSLSLSFVNNYPELTETLKVQGATVGKGEKGYEVALKGLEPDNLYEGLASLTLTYEDASYTKSYSFRTDPLTLTTLQPKIVSLGNAIVAAETNLDDGEGKVGFEWRRTEWTDEFDSRFGAAYLYQGVMEGYIRNLNVDKLWKFRPYYTSGAGNTYYGDWKGMDPSDYSYFEPTVHTYTPFINLDNIVELIGYVMRGTDNVTIQGFIYWNITISSSSRRNAKGVPEDAMVVEAEGHVMKATLDGLEGDTEYCCMAFAKTESGETFYGEPQMFRTNFDPDGIKEIENGELKVESSDEEWFDLSGRKLDKPQRGINIIRYADGTSKKLIRK